MDRGLFSKEREHKVTFFSFLKCVISALVIDLCLGWSQMVAAQPPANEKADVIIVGAGLSGLSAAHTLVSQGYSVIVLEARDRVSGRAWTKPYPGAWIDMGAQYIGPGQDHILGLAKTLGIKTFPAYYEGTSIYVFNGKQGTFSMTGSMPLTAAELQEFHETEKKLDDFAATVPVDNPALAPRAEEWDSQTLATWIRDNVPTSRVKYLFHTFVQGYFAAEPKDVSFLHFLFYIHAAGGLDQLHGSGLLWRFDGGVQQIADKISQQLSKSIRLNMPVREIDQTMQGVTVVTENQQHFDAKAVIVAMSPTLTSRIIYKPSIPANRDQFTQHAPMGTSIKIHAVYPTAFWRKKGLSGQVLTDSDDVTIIVDNSPPSGKPGILAGFLEGKEGRKWADLPQSELKKMAIAEFTKYFGSEAASPEAFFIANWAQETWSRGCYSGVLPTGVWTGFPGEIRKPIGRIHWAGTETATAWFAYMDGAVSSGERAANEVIHDFKKGH